MNDTVVLFKKKQHQNKWMLGWVVELINGDNIILTREAKIRMGKNEEELFASH